MKEDTSLTEKDFNIILKNMEEPKYNEKLAYVLKKKLSFKIL